MYTARWPMRRPDCGEHLPGATEALGPGTPRYRYNIALSGLPPRPDAGPGRAVRSVCRLTTSTCICKHQETLGRWVSLPGAQQHASVVLSSPRCFSLVSNELSMFCAHTARSMHPPPSPDCDFCVSYSLMFVPLLPYTTQFNTDVTQKPKPMRTASVAVM